MLYFVFGEYEDDCVSWRVNEPDPLHRKNLSAKDVIEVQADGHELEYIQKHMNNLPTAPKTRVVSWFGDHARFIAANLFRARDTSSN